MCAKLFDEQGNTVEALTPEEVETKLNEVREVTIEETNKLRDEEVTDLSGQMEAKEKELEEAKAALEAEKNKDKNLAGQRGVIDQKNKEVEELKTQIGTLQTTIETKFAEQKTEGLSKMVNSFIKGLAGDDKNLTDKVKFFYDSFKLVEIKDKTPEQVEEEVRQRVQNAYTIAIGGVKPSNPLNAVISSAGGAVPLANPTGEKISPEAAEAAKQMGLTDQDLQKHKLV
jgi:hypothetical protein